MKAMIVLFAFILSLPAIVNASNTLHSVGLGLNYRAEKGVDQKYWSSLEDQSLYGRYQFKESPWALQLQLHRLNKEKETGSLSTSYVRFEFNSDFIYWLNQESNWKLFLGAGPGLSREKVEVTLRGQKSEKVYGDWLYSLTTVAGINRQFLKSLDSQLSVQYFHPIDREERQKEWALSLLVGYAFN